MHGNQEKARMIRLKPSFFLIIILLVDNAAAALLVVVVMEEMNHRCWLCTSNAIVFSTSRRHGSEIEKTKVVR